MAEVRLPGGGPKLRGLRICSRRFRRCLTWKEEYSREAWPRASEFLFPVWSKTSDLWRRLRRHAPSLGGLTALLAALCAAGVAAATARVTPLQAKLTSTLEFAAAMGAMMAARQARPSVSSAEGYENSALLSLAGDFIVRHRIDGRVTSIEGDGLAQFATSADEFIGYGLVDRLHEDDRADFLDVLKAAAEDGCTQTTTVRIRNSADNYVVADIKIRRICAGDDGALISAFRAKGAALDLAAQLETAREEARLEKSLKDRLLANMSHELRTPLNAILGFSEILGDRALLPADLEKRIEYARIIHASADHLLSVVNLVLDMSRIEAGKFSILPEPLELGPLIGECCDMLRLRANAGGVRIVQTPLAEGLEIVADRGACRQIIVNLLSNAVKFTPPNGTVTIDARVEDDSAHISVTDTGIGIKPDDLPRLGDPFFQVKSGYNRNYDGAGLGLSLVRGLVGLHDGAVTMESAFGVGTRVTAVLPLMSRPAPQRVVSAHLRTIPWLCPPKAAAAERREERRIA
jgi:cell cycle sensor histidine kinase DivJ